jgi:hypothetical protein
VPGAKHAHARKDPPVRQAYFVIPPKRSFFHKKNYEKLTKYKEFDLDFIECKRYTKYK